MGIAYIGNIIASITTSFIYLDVIDVIYTHERVIPIINRMIDKENK